MSNRDAAVHIAENLVVALCADPTVSMEARIRVTVSILYGVVCATVAKEQHDLALAYAEEQLAAVRAALDRRRERNPVWVQ